MSLTRPLITLAALAALTAAPGCFTDSAVGGSTPCADDSDCPAGWTCDASGAASYCKAPPGADAGFDAGGGDTPAPPDAVRPDVPAPECDTVEDCWAYEDDDLCNGVLTCRAGRCVVDEDTVVRCPPSPSPCVLSVCEPGFGECVIAPQPAGAACETDGDPCTLEVCTAGGKCRFEGVDETLPGCGPPPVCQSDADCNDGDPCTWDQCGPDGLCFAKFDPQRPGCGGGGCKSDADCNDGSPCTWDSCGGDGQCYYKFDESLPGCGGGCTTDADCMQLGGGPCSVGWCTASGQCIFEPISCDDGLACTKDWCDPMAGGCVSMWDPNAVEKCWTGYDEDCDGVAGCADPDCAGTTWCGGGGGSCGPNVIPLACGETLWNELWAEQSYMSQYACSDGAWPGAEVVFQIKSDVPGVAVLRLFAEIPPEAGQVFILHGECHSDVCVQAQPLGWEGEVKVDLLPGLPIYVVADAQWEGPMFVYEASLECPQAEVCFDNIDNDWDGLIDCKDPDCLAPGAGCETSESLCDDGFDNDVDGLIDCFDPDCKALGPPCQDTEALCNDHLDNDGDGFLDCADPDCKAAHSWCGYTEMNCADNVDNDGDGYVDCADPKCKGKPICIETCGEDAPTLTCGQGWFEPQPIQGGSSIDSWSCTNESLPGDEVVFSFVPPYDTTIQFWAYGEPWGATRLLLVEDTCDSNHCVTVGGGWQGDMLTWSLEGGKPYWLVVDSTVEGPVFLYESQLQCSDPEVCDDGQDNDWDGKIDCADLDCLANGPPCEAAETSCGDGLDNDGDSFVDCEDANCQLQGAPCQSAETVCNDGIDNDGDGLTDCAETVCKGAAPCEVVETKCEDGLDNDGDGLVDCDDANCALTNPDCVQQCSADTPVVDLFCGEWSPEAFGGEPGGISVYGCGSQEMPGWEALYRFVAPQTGKVEFRTFAEPWGAAQIFVLAGECASDTCVATSPPMIPDMAFVTFEVTAGQTYWIAVDAPFDGPIFTFEAQLACF